MKNNKLLACPYIVWMILFTIIPLGIVFYYALTDSITGQFTLANLAGMGTYLPIFLRSIWLSLFASLICLVIGYPVAYFIAQCKPLTQRFLEMLIMLPMCMSFLLRTLAWVGLLQDTGIINNILDAIGIGRLRLIRTPGAVILGMVYNYLPYMILPLYGVIVKIDPRLIEAAEDLGCNSTQVFSRVVLPLSVHHPDPFPGAHPHELARHQHRHHHGVRPGGVHLLYLPEAGRYGHGAHRRRDRAPVQAGQQPQSGRGAESGADDSGIHLHRHHEPLRRRQ